MAAKPLISIIVPVYNVEAYLRECIESILAQTYQNLEIILINDGSTDQSENILNDYAKRFKNIKAIHQKHGGVSSARNTGIKHASGEWISFVDPDDYAKNNFVETLYEIAIKNKADISTCSFTSFSEEKSILKNPPIWPAKPLSGHNAINESMKHKRPAYLPLNLFRASLFRNGSISFPVGQEYEDIAAKIKLLYYAKKVAFTNQKLYMYRIRKDSITGKKFSASRYRDFTDALRDVREFLEKSTDQAKFIYLNYFEFYSMVTLLNYLAREKKTPDTKKYWREIRKKLISVYRKTTFPSTKTKVIYTLIMILSASRPFYSSLYKISKKTSGK